MAARSLKEGLLAGLNKKGCYPSADQMNEAMGEARDVLAHAVARFCKRHNAMKDYDILTQFIQEIVKDMPSVSAGNIAQEILDKLEAEGKLE